MDNVITEKDLLSELTCSMISYEPTDPFDGIERAFNWAVLQRHNNKTVTLEQYRQKFTEEWNADWGSKPRGPGYWQGPRRAARFARRMQELLGRYRVVEPMQAFPITVLGQNCSSRSCVLEKEAYRGGSVRYAVSVSLREKRLRSVPDPMALARWLEVSKWDGSADLRILTVPLVFGLTREIKDPNLVLVRRQVEGIIGRMDNKDMFVPGSWCKGCEMPCRKVLRG